MIRPSYEVAALRRPAGACYCDLDDHECYAAGHWEPVPDGHGCGGPWCPHNCLGSPAGHGGLCAYHLRRRLVLPVITTPETADIGMRRRDGELSGKLVPEPDFPDNALDTF